MTSSAASIDDLRDFLDASPSPFHAVHRASRRLAEAGFADAREGASDRLAERGFVARDGALIAWSAAPGAAPGTPFSIVGAHSDSPCLRVKPRPETERSGWRQLNVEVYGGILNNSWLDRDLGLAGRVVGDDGSSRLLDVREPIARVPQLAVHLDRGVNDGLTLDPQAHLQPVWAVGPTAAPFGEWLAERVGLDRPPTFWDLCLYDVQPSAVLGVDRSMLASGRLDNLVSCWAGTTALIDASPTAGHAVLVLNDHEEVGSSSATGAAGALLERILERLSATFGGDRSDHMRALDASQCVSADNAHAVHPNYPERHDPDHMPRFNAGPAIKVNANQRYATSAVTAQRFGAACERAGVPHQVFVSRNNMPCGSTIGPITATRLGIDTVDVGVPQLSMHSARELCGTADPVWLTAALTELLGDA